MTKPIKCICHSSPKFRKADIDAMHRWYIECACGRQTLSYETKEEAASHWNHRINNERGVRNE